jgi:hypothetical protein
LLKDYSNYQPLILDSADIGRLTSDEYAGFIMDAAIEPGVRLIVRRNDMRPEYPYIDTKFNPNTGREFPEKTYDIVYSWVLGRGSEALAGHLPVIESLHGLTDAEKHKTRSAFGGMMKNMTSAIIEMMERNEGGCPFMTDRSFRPVDAEGNRIESAGDARTFGHIFCAKGIIAEGSADTVARGYEMVKELVRFAGENRIGGDRGPLDSEKLSHGGRMIMLGTLALMARRGTEPAMKEQALDAAEEFIGYILDHHYDPDTAVFAEYIDPTGTKRLDMLDPGHANELVGLGLLCLELMAGDPDAMTESRKSLIERCAVELPRLLAKSTELGWNDRHDGMHKLVNTKTGEVLDDDLPWWNLPETMRAGVRAYEAAKDESVRAKCLEAVRICHNAYFTRYLNRDLMLFPYQTRSGATGEVIDKPPAIPEGDPLYHVNLTLLDYLTVLRRLR